jgi:hypothetical protein
VKVVTWAADSDAAGGGGGSGGGGSGGDHTAGGGDCEEAAMAAARRQGTAVRPDLSMVLVISSQSRKMFRKPTQSRWHLVAPSLDAKLELQRELKSTS